MRRLQSRFRYFKWFKAVFWYQEEIKPDTVGNWSRGPSAQVREIYVGWKVGGEWRRRK